MSIPEALYAPEAEVSVLAAPLVAGPEDGDRVRRVLEDLPADAYSSEAHRVIWATMQELHGRGVALDVVTLGDRLRATGELDQAGGMEYLAELLDAVPTAANIQYHARIVREKWTRRQLRSFGQNLERDAGSVTLEDLRTSLEQAPLMISANGSGPPGRSAAEILADPEAREPPRPVVEPLAWERRTTVFSAREKRGKTTVMIAGAACVTSGRRWLGAPTEAGSVVWWPGAKESTAADVAVRHEDFGGDPRRLYLIEDRGEPFELLDRAVAVWGPRLLVVDSLSALVESAGLDLESGDAAGWGRVMGRLARIARNSGAAVVVIHHGRKEDGSYRDSTAIGAAADMLVALREGETADERRLSPVGRWAAPEVRVRLVEVNDGVSRFERVSGDLSLDAQVLLFIERHAGCSTRNVRDGVPGRARQVDAALKRLLDSDAVEDRGDGRARALFVTNPPETPETRTDTPRTRSGHGNSTGHGGSVSGGGRDPLRGVPPRDTPPGPADRPEATCADCGVPIEPNPAFAVNRCARCALAAGKRSDAGAPTDG